MREVRKKQKNFYKFLKSLVIFSVVFIFIYIGAQPYVRILKMNLKTQVIILILVIKKALNKDA